MNATFTKQGDGYALIIDKPLLDALNIIPDTPMEITSDGHTITLTPAENDDLSEEELAEGSKVMHEQYGEVFRKLAE